MIHLVSIIIPTYNRAHFIGQTLDSVLVQTYENWECIVVDDGSSDYTDELLEFYVEKDSRIQYHHRPNDRLKGANACRNYGFELSRGEFINWFDSDDILKNFFFELCVLSLSDHEVDVVFLKYVIFEKNLKNSKFESNNNTSKEQLMRDLCCQNINLGTSSVFFRRKYLQNNKFNESVHRCQDLDFFFELFKLNPPNFLIKDQILFSVRYHSQTITNSYYRNSLKSINSELKIRVKMLSYAQNAKWSKTVIKQLTQKYKEAFIKLFENYNIWQTYTEIRKFKKAIRLNTNFIFFEFKFYVYLLIFKLTQRKHRLYCSLNKLPEYLK